MTHYYSTPHAITRFRERVPELSAIHQDDRDCGRWIARMASRGHVVGSQTGMDLMLRVEVPTTHGLRVLFMPVAPEGHHDHWSIKTVLSEEQGAHNLAEVDARRWKDSRRSWREHKHIMRPDLRPGRKTAMTQECRAA